MFSIFQGSSSNKAMPLSSRIEEEKDDRSEENQDASFLNECSALELSQYLIEERFQSPAAAASFLQAAFNHAERTSISAVEQSQTEISGEFQAPLLLEEMETSFMTPRMGKVKIQLAESGNKGGLLATRLSITNATQQQQFYIPKGSVSHLIVFPKPEDCKLIRSNMKSTKQRVPKAHVVLIKMRAPIKFQGKDTEQICFTLPWNKAEGPTGPKLVDAEDGEAKSWPEATEAWRRVLTKALKGNDDDKVVEGGQEIPPMTVTQVRVDNPVFTSHMDTSTSTTTSGMPFVSCNLGVQDGVLYPLQQGLLFFKPPRFIARTSLKELVFGRGASAGQSSSRYVDMAVVLKEGDESNLKKMNNLQEFTNIQGQEQGALEEYKENFLTPYLQKETNEDDSMDTDEEGNVNVEEVGDDDSEDDSDENFDDSEEETDGDDDDEGSDVEGVVVVNDDFAQELVRNKRKNDSETESEDADSSAEPTAPRKKRQSKRGKR